MATALVHLRGRRKEMREDSGTQVRRESRGEEEKDAGLVEYMHSPKVKSLLIRGRQMGLF